MGRICTSTAITLNGLDKTIADVVGGFSRRLSNNLPANFIIKLCQSMWVSALTKFNFVGNLTDTSLSQRFCSFKSFRQITTR